jgi:hypothetical protein
MLVLSKAYQAVSLVSWREFAVMAPAPLETMSHSPNQAEASPKM